VSQEKREVLRGNEKDFEDLMWVMRSVFKSCWNILVSLMLLSIVASFFITLFVFIDFWRPSGGGYQNAFYSFENSGVPTADTTETIYLQGQLMNVCPGLLYFLAKEEEDWIGFWVKTSQGTYDYRWFPEGILFLTSTSPQPGDLIRISRVSGNEKISVIIEEHTPFDDSFKASLTGYLQRKGIKSMPTPPL
jgi:hypothetical protein